MLLVDTSVWVGHFRKGDKRLAESLRTDQVLCHRFVIGELACGNLRNRDEVLALLSALSMVPKADDREVIDFIGQHRLMGKGLGLIDVHLLASCLLAGVRLWTRDARLAQAASHLGISAV
jgi:hypothetical protein